MRLLKISPSLAFIFNRHIKGSTMPDYSYAGELSRLQYYNSLDFSELFTRGETCQVFSC